MKKKLTPRLLSFLIRKGYKYCLSQIPCINPEDNAIDITLKPVKKHPLLQKLPEPFSAYYNILLEPLEMTSGLDNTRVMVELNPKDAAKFELVYPS